MTKAYHEIGLTMVAVSVKSEVGDIFFKIDGFLPRDASAERGNATVSRLSVCLSVCPSVCPSVRP